MEPDETKRRVLIVDDHAVFRESVRMIIDDMPDFRVSGEAETAAQAINACRHTEFELILLDVRLPDRPGDQIAQALRANGVTAKIIALSMRDEKTVRRRMLNAGADAFVSKAAGAGALMDTIRGCF
ncbi:MAG: response regulator [Thermodesulfobacteriota bacterium]